MCISDLADICSGSDWLKGGNAELGTDSWMFNGTGANVTSVYSKLTNH